MRISESKKKTFSSFFRLLGSLKLAVSVVVFFVLFFSLATIAESYYNTPFAQRYFYHNPLFSVVILLFLANISVSAYLRWPWKKKHIPFLLAHLGMWVLSAGVFIGKWQAQEGLLVLPENTRSRTLRMEGAKALHLWRKNAQTARYESVFNLPAQFDSQPFVSNPNFKFEFQKDQVDYQFLVKEYYPDLHSQTSFEENNFNLSTAGQVHFEALIPTFNQPLPIKLSSQAGDSIRFLNIPESGSAAGSSQEIIFSLHKFINIAESENFLKQISPRPNLGESSDTSEPKWLIDFVWQKQTFHWPITSQELKKISYVSGSQNSAKAKPQPITLPLPERFKGQIQLVEFYPDFAVNKKGPFSKSDLPLNPVLLYRMQDLETKASDFNFLFLNNPEARIESIMSVQQSKPYLIHFSSSTRANQRALPGLYFLLIWTNAGIQKKIVQINTLGQQKIIMWPQKNQWIEVWPQIKIKDTFSFFSPQQKFTLKSASMKPNREALIFEVWANKAPFEKKMVQDIIQFENGAKEFELNGEQYLLKFQAQRRALDFWLGLLQFKVHYRPGSQIVKSYNSFVNVYQNQNENSLILKNFPIFMNHPLRFLGYEFYQSSYVLGNNYGPNTTVLSVRYDPGKYLVYLGYILIILGMILLFYFRKKFYGTRI